MFSLVVVEEVSSGACGLALLINIATRLKHWLASNGKCTTMDCLKRLQHPTNPGTHGLTEGQDSPSTASGLAAAESKVLATSPIILLYELMSLFCRNDYLSPHQCVAANALDCTAYEYHATRHQQSIHASEQWSSEHPHHSSVWLPAGLAA